MTPDFVSNCLAIAPPSKVARNIHTRGKTNVHGSLMYMSDSNESRHTCNESRHTCNESLSDSCTS